MTSSGSAGLAPMAPVFLVDLFPGLHAELMTLLRGLKPMNRPTACALWSVKDIAAHLLDGHVRRLSFGRDGLTATPDVPISSYTDLVGYLNRLNAEWTAAARRLSPRVLIELLDFTSGQVHAFFRSLDPHELALFPVAWAGEGASQNWFDIGREYNRALAAPAADTRGGRRGGAHRPTLASPDPGHLCPGSSVHLSGCKRPSWPECPVHDRR